MPKQLQRRTPVDEIEFHESHASQFSDAALSTLRKAFDPSFD
ncbi:MAG: hypothetical protein NVV83_15760 [Afipia sp.]|nr:hypothetical protein [Afipia sp.]